VRPEQEDSNIPKALNNQLTLQTDAADAQRDNFQPSSELPMSSEVGSIIAPISGTIPGVTGGVPALTNITLVNSNIYSNQLRTASDKLSPTLSKTRAFEPLSSNLKNATSTARAGLPTHLSLSTREGSSPSPFSKHGFSSGLLSGDDEPQISRPSTQPHASERQARLSDLYKSNESESMSHRFPDKVTSHISHETTSELYGSQQKPPLFNTLVLKDNHRESIILGEAISEDQLFEFRVLEQGFSNVINGKEEVMQTPVKMQSEPLQPASGALPSNGAQLTKATVTVPCDETPYRIEPFLCRYPARDNPQKKY